MPDLLAGSKVKAIDTPPTVSDSQADLFTFTATTYGVAVTSGTYADCGVAFVAPTTGRVIVKTIGFLRASAAGLGALVAPVIREGATVGSGTVVVAANDMNAIQANGTGSNTDGCRLGAEALIEGLTPGGIYNVRLEHRVNGSGIGTATRRTVIVAPAT